MYDVKDNILSVNGWLAFAFLTFITIFSYYSVGYPILSSEFDKNFWYKLSTSGPNKDVNVEVRIPKYVASFEDSEINFIMSNSRKEENLFGIVVSGKLMIDGDPTPKETALFTDTHDIKLQNNRYLSQLLLEFDLKGYGSQSQKIWTHVTNPYLDQGARVVFEINSVSDGYTFTWSANEDSTCADELCAHINPLGVFRRVAIERLLLSPWSNTVMPIAVFALVWLVEKILKSAYQKTDKEESKESKYISIQFWPIFFTACFLLIVFILEVFFVLVKSYDSIVLLTIVMFGFNLAFPFLLIESIKLSESILKNYLFSEFERTARLEIDKSKNHVEIVKQIIKLIEKKDFGFNAGWFKIWLFNRYKMDPLPETIESFKNKLVETIQQNDTPPKSEEDRNDCCN